MFPMLMISTDPANGASLNDFTDDEDVREYVLKKYKGADLTKEQLAKALRFCRNVRKFRYVSIVQMISMAREVTDYTEMELEMTREDIVKLAMEHSLSKGHKYTEEEIKGGFRKLRKDRDPEKVVTPENILEATILNEGHEIPRPPQEERLRIHYLFQGAMNFFKGMRRRTQSLSRLNDAGSTGGEDAGAGEPEEDPAGPTPFLRRRNMSLTFKDSVANVNALRDLRNPAGGPANKPPGLPYVRSTKNRSPVPPGAPSTSDAPGPSGTHDSAPSETPTTSDASGPSGATSKPIEAVKIEHQGSPSRKRKESNDSSSSSNPSESSMSGNPNPSKNRGLGREISGENPLENPDEPSTSETPGSGSNELD